MAYPKYVISYAGAPVPQDDTAQGNLKRITIGPHSFLMNAAANTVIKVDVTHNPAVDNIPNLTVTFSQE